MFCIGLIGIFILVVLRKRFIIDYRLHYPSGTATGILISSFHTPKGEEAAKQQVKQTLYLIPYQSMAIISCGNIGRWNTVFSPQECQNSKVAKAW